MADAPRANDYISGDMIMCLFKLNLSNRVNDDAGDAFWFFDWRLVDRGGLCVMSFCQQT